MPDSKSKLLDVDEWLGPESPYRDKRKLLRAILARAQSRKIPITVENDADFLLRYGHGEFVRRTSKNHFSTSPRLGIDIAKDKVVANWLLTRAGLPVPPGRAVSTIEQAVSAAQQLGFPVVAKPARGSHSKGVVLDIRTEEELREAFMEARAKAINGLVLIEKYLKNRQFRLTVLEDRVCTIQETRRPFVTGDGNRSIEELIGALNAEPGRGNDPDCLLKPVPLDAQTIRSLERQGFSPETVLPGGEHVELTLFAHTQTGASVANVSRDAHPDNLRIVRQAARAVGLSAACTMDILSTDFSTSLFETGGVIVDINGQSGYTSGYYVHDGENFDVGSDLIDAWFPEGRPVRPPIVGIVRSNVSPQLTDALSAKLGKRGARVGIATESTLRVANTPLTCAGQSISGRLGTLLANPWTDVAVAEFDAESNENVLLLHSIDVMVVPGQQSASEIEHLLDSSTILLRLPAGISARHTNKIDSFAQQIAGALGRLDD